MSDTTNKLTDQQIGLIDRALIFCSSNSFEGFTKQQKDELHTIRMWIKNHPTIAKEELVYESEEVLSH